MAQNKQKQKFKLTHARHAPEICLAPGLFRSLKRGDKKRQKFHVVYDYRKYRYEFLGPELLGANDLRVLQGIVAMVAVSYLALPPEPKTEIERRLRLAVGLDDKKWAGAIAVRISYRALAREIGYAESDGKAIKLIKESIERMRNVSIFSRRLGVSYPDECRYRLLGTSFNENSSGELYVVLGPMFVLSVLGHTHTRIELSETRALKSDAALITHQRLCALINPGKSKRVSIDKLCEYPWPDAVNGATMRQRRARMRRALAELEQIGWTVTEYAAGKFEIVRPAKPVV